MFYIKTLAVHVLSIPPKNQSHKGVIQNFHIYFRLKKDFPKVFIAINQPVPKQLCPLCVSKPKNYLPTQQVLFIETCFNPLIDHIISFLLLIQGSMTIIGDSSQFPFRPQLSKPHFKSVIFKAKETSIKAPPPCSLPQLFFPNPVLI